MMTLPAYLNKNWQGDSAHEEMMAVRNLTAKAVARIL
jgi:hypothetical protein